MELWEAHRCGLPVVVLDVNAGYDPDDARQLLSSLETELEARNPGALATVEGRLKAQGATLAQMKEALFGLLNLHEPTASQSLSWDPSSSDQLLLAATKDLVECLARVTGRGIGWRDPLDERSAARSASSEHSTRPCSGGLMQQPLAGSDPGSCAESSLASAPPTPGRTRRLHAFLKRMRRPSNLVTEASQPRVSSGSPAGSPTRKSGGSDGGFRLFISYARAEASAHARLLHARFEAQLGGRVYLDATDAYDLDEILDSGLCRARALVLLQTASVLQRPCAFLVSSPQTR